MATEAEIYSVLTELFQDIFMRDDLMLTAELTAAEVKGWDSFKQIEIIMATEERFGIQMKSREIDSLRNVGDLVRLVEAKTK